MIQNLIFIFSIVCFMFPQELSCGQSNVITDIHEDRTCHYMIAVSLIRLCTHAEFAPEVVHVKRVNFEPSNPVESHVLTE